MRNNLCGIVLLLVGGIGCSEGNAGGRRARDGSEERTSGAATSRSPSMSFDNPLGAAASAPVATGSAGSFAPNTCEPGLYVGTYNCEVEVDGDILPLSGVVSFNLEVNTMRGAADCQEFCMDLVIQEGTSTLFGLLGAIGFETALKGGLDCSTGEFRSIADMGIYGLGAPVDSNNPDGEWTVVQPPLGNFNGELKGVYSNAVPQSITGDWNLADGWSGAACIGPFMVTLTPP